MSIMGARASVVAAIGIGLVAGLAEAAEIIVNNPDQDGRVFVDIVGNIEVGDEKTFREKVGVVRQFDDLVHALDAILHRDLKGWMLYPQVPLFPHLQLLMVIHSRSGF
jgi:hypothetical protein